MAWQDLGKVRRLLVGLNQHADIRSLTNRNIRQFTTKPWRMISQPIGQTLYLSCTVMFNIYDGRPDYEMIFYSFSHLAEWLQLIVVPRHYIGLLFMALIR